MDLEIAGEEVIEVIESVEDFPGTGNNVFHFCKPCFFCPRSLIHFPSVSSSETVQFEKCITSFCQFLELPQEPFERGLREAPLCHYCLERIQLIATILNEIEKMQGKLISLRDAIRDDLKLNYNQETDDAVNFEPCEGLEELRNHLKQKLLISSDLEDFANKTAVKKVDNSRFSDVTNSHYNEKEYSTVTIAVTTFSSENNSLEPSCEFEESGVYHSTSPYLYVADSIDEEENGDNREFNYVSMENPQGYAETQLHEDSAYYLHSLENLTSSKEEAVSGGVPNWEKNNLAQEEVIQGNISAGMALRNCSINLKRLTLEPQNMLKSGRYKLCLQTLPSNKIQCSFEDPSKGRCRWRFADDEKLHAHVRRVHMQIKPDHIYKCQFCGQCKGSKKKIEDHEKIHTGIKDYTCELCGVSVRNEKFLLEHKRKLHGEAYPFVCESCNKGFNDKQYFDAHLLTHAGKYKHRCEVCNAGFAFRNTLRKHMLTHLGSDIYECHVCNKTMRFKGSLTRHMRSHTGDKPHICHICQKGFIDSAKLKNHASIHTKERPFLCQKCGANFRLKDHLISHLKSHERNKEKNLNSEKAGNRKYNYSALHRKRTKSASSATEAATQEYIDTQPNSETESEVETTEAAERLVMLESIFEN